MINLSDYKYGTKFNLTLSDNESEVDVCAELQEIEWAPNRKPFIAYLVIKDTEDFCKWPKDSKIFLEVNFDQDKEYMFLLECPSKLGAGKTLRRKAKIHMN
jgi:hypothetical protein